MKISAIGLQNFRNIAATRLEFAGRLQFLLGPNGQGKTNLLEAIGFITALRSFRAADNAHLIGHGQKEAALACDLEHEVEGPSKLTIKFRPGVKEAWLEETKVARLADVIGRFPTVIFSSQDQQLVRGSPGGRRRWLDLTLSATDAAYLAHLQSYHRALADRNALLKRDPADAELDAFELGVAEMDGWLGGAYNSWTWGLSGNTVTYTFTGNLPLSVAPEPSTYVMTGALLCFIGFNQKSRNSLKKIFILLSNKLNLPTYIEKFTRSQSHS